MVSAAPDPFEAAAAALERGGVVAIPTDTVYGLAARAEDSAACARIFDLKGRPDHVALPVLVASLEQAVPFVDEDELSGLARLAEAFWPGPLTIVVVRRAGLGLDLGGDPAHVGLRLPDDPLIEQLCRRVGALATTSANRHQEPPCHTAEEVRAVFGESLGYILDKGRRDGRPSTVVSLVGEAPRLLREGPIDFDDVCDVLGGR